ncbi:nitroreductase family deazaflavin-dependent oxidoreductase [Segniliparus rugosus]|uniref:Deazaflavin-dependent nitroreductase n=1 Tax=Segniliparus rugosus (strain ATCC BAA-974 / DSM 45345 / CCUG 50838 / CIP 108380 / JCM 13579 / CDC 945) TaxID=679197 RepID=E5XQQ6_SEGRC|nr:nitroreductase family deazaflavin-dependent oxidoreductase [Segniliparus rugosus]EFV13317.1 deazaflavin-dependent nitroreductase [Segniliparus rugosus ATCC BAA-974]
MPKFKFWKIPAKYWPYITKGHVAVYELSRGLVGHWMPGMAPALILHHTGAKSGKQYKIPLNYFVSNDDFVVVASNGGHPKNPNWFWNLKANPDTRIRVGLRELRVTAREATAEERADWWPKIATTGAYAIYQRRTKRTIPLVVLSPAHQQ